MSEFVIQHDTGTRRRKYKYKRDRGGTKSYRYRTVSYPCPGLLWRDRPAIYLYIYIYIHILELYMYILYQWRCIKLGPWGHFAHDKVLGLLTPTSAERRLVHITVIVHNHTHPSSPPQKLFSQRLLEAPTGIF